METTVYIEIPVTMTFSVDPGQKGNWNQPEFPATIEDINYDKKQVLEALDNEIYGEKSTIDEDLWDAVKEMEDLPF